MLIAEAKKDITKADLKASLRSAFFDLICQFSAVHPQRSRSLFKLIFKELAGSPDISELPVYFVQILRPLYA